MIYFSSVLYLPVFNGHGRIVEHRSITHCIYDLWKLARYMYMQHLILKRNELASTLFKKLHWFLNVILLCLISGSLLISSRELSSFLCLEFFKEMVSLPLLMKPIVHTIRFFK